MERAQLLKETNNVRKAILGINPTLKADTSVFKSGKALELEGSLMFALHLLKHAEFIFEKNQAESVASMGIAIGLGIAHGLVIEEADGPDLSTMKPANTLRA